MKNDLSIKNKNYSFKYTSILLLVCLYFELEFSFYSFNKNKIDKSKDSILAILNSDLHQGNSYFLSRSITQLINLEVINCVKLSEVHPTKRIFFTNKNTKDNCISNRWDVDELFTSNNGQSWEIKVTIKKSQFFIFLQWFLRVVFLALISLVYMLFIKRDNFLTLLNLQVSKELEKIKKELVEKSKYEAIADLSKQVAHDIRSPLSALNMIVSMTSELPENKKTILMQAINRISEIADNLLKKKTKETLIANPIVITIDEAIKEKKLELKATNSKVNIYFTPKISEILLFTLLQPNQLKRVLSNILNNSIEAFTENAGDISLHLSSNKKMIFLQITDNGKGVPQSILNKIGQKGFSHGKEGNNKSGSGLGLYGAKKIISNAGGSLEISNNSSLKKGAQVSISLPRVFAQNYFLDNLNFLNKNNIVIVDDDVNIHNLWKEVFKTNPVSLTHLYSPEEFETKFSSHLETSFFLIDYNFHNSEKNGFEIINKYQLNKQSIIVTGNSLNSELVELATKNNLHLFPKSLLEYLVQKM